MASQEVYVGIDVSKGCLDVHLRPLGIGFSVSNEAAGYAALIARLRPLRVKRHRAGGDRRVQRPLWLALSEGRAGHSGGQPAPGARVRPRRGAAGQDRSAGRGSDRPFRRDLCAVRQQRRRQHVRHVMGGADALPESQTASRRKGSPRNLGDRGCQTGDFRLGRLATRLRLAQALPPQPGDLRDPLGADAMLAASRSRTAVTQRRRPAAAVTAQPAIALPLRQTGGLGRLCHPPTAFVDPPHQQESTLRRNRAFL
jgi:hypothetical protein